jgi:regulator of sigma D
MPGTHEVVKERRAASRAMIKELVGVRDHVLALYADLAAKHPFAETAPVTRMLETFCQSLIDYTADTHFRLYRYIDEKRERRRPVIEIADRVYPGILDSTDAILDFNDKYDFTRGRETIDLSSLESDLSRLGERLADRIELEDQIIAALSQDKGPV